MRHAARRPSRRPTGCLFGNPPAGVPAPRARRSQSSQRRTCRAPVMESSDRVVSYGARCAGFQKSAAKRTESRVATKARAGPRHAQASLHANNNYGDVFPARRHRLRREGTRGTPGRVLRSSGESRWDRRCPLLRRRILATRYGRRSTNPGWWLGRVPSVRRRRSGLQGNDVRPYVGLWASDHLC